MYRFDTDLQITHGLIPEQSIVSRLLNLHPDTSVSRSLVEAKHSPKNSLIFYFLYYENTMEREDGGEATPLSHDLRPWIV